jgi:hypothetical protein
VTLFRVMFFKVQMRTESRPHVRGCGNTLAVSMQTQWLPLNNFCYMTCLQVSSMELGPCKPTSLLGSSFGQFKSHAPPREWLRFTEHEKDELLTFLMLYTLKLSYIFVRHGFLVVRLAVAALPFILLWCCSIVFLASLSVSQAPQYNLVDKH